MGAEPFLAITLNAKRRLNRVERAHDLPRGLVVSGTLDMWEACWEAKSAHVTAFDLMSCFGPDPRIPAAMVSAGFLVPDKAGEWDLAPEDADRLLRTHKQRVAAGRARAETAERALDGTLVASSSGNPAGDQRTTSGQPATDQRPASGPPAANQLLHPAPSTQHPAPKKKDSAAGASAPAAATELTLAPTPGDAPTRQRSEAMQFHAHFQAERQRIHGLLPEPDPPAAQLNAWFKRALELLAGGRDPPLERLWASGAAYLLKDEYWKPKGAPFKGFMTESVWRKHVPAEVRGETRTG